MSRQGGDREPILSRLREDAERVGGLPPQELQELARLVDTIASLPDESPGDEELERGRQRLLLALQGRRGAGWAQGLPFLRAAAVLVVAVGLGLLALGGAFAAGARLPQPVAVGPLAPLGSERSEIARDNHGQDVSEVARSASGPGRGQQVRDAATGNSGQSGPGGNSGPGRSDDVAVEDSRDNSGPGSSSATDNIQFVGTVQQQAQGRLVVNGVTVIVTAATEIEGQLSTGVVVKVEGTLQADGTVVAREIEVQAPPATPPAVTPPAGAIRIELRGRVQSLFQGGFTVAGRTIHVSASTEVDGQVSVGVLVKVEGFVLADGSVQATEVDVEGAREGPSGPGGTSQPQEVPDDRGGRGRGGD